MSTLLANRVEHPQGDLEPPLELFLWQGALAGDAGAVLQPDGSWAKPINLATAVRVEVTIRRLAGGQRVMRRDATIVDAATGHARIVWQAGDPVETLGDYRVVARIFWPGPRPQTVPTREQDSWTLRVHADA